MTRSNLAIEVSGLVKTFGDVRAVDGVDLAVPRGSVYGVLGPNGAGKTTTIRMLATLLAPDGGSARVLGHDVVDEADVVRGLVSLTGQLASVDEDLTGKENLVLLGWLLGLKRPAAKARASELLAAFELEDAAGRLVKHYSGGMRRRLDLAASIVVTPELLFLDEPTTGLDPRSRNQVWKRSTHARDGGGVLDKSLDGLDGGALMHRISAAHDGQRSGVAMGGIGVGVDPPAVTPSPPPRPRDTGAGGPPIKWIPGFRPHSRADHHHAGQTEPASEEPETRVRGCTSAGGAADAEQPTTQSQVSARTADGPRRLGTPRGQCRNQETPAQRVSIGCVSGWVERWVSRFSPSQDCRDAQSNP